MGADSDRPEERGGQRRRAGFTNPAGRRGDSDDRSGRSRGRDGDARRGGRPNGDRPVGDRRRSDRPDGERRYGDRPGGDRRQGASGDRRPGAPGERRQGGRPTGDRPTGDRRPGGDRPFGDRRGDGARGGSRDGARRPYQSGSNQSGSNQSGSNQRGSDQRGSDQRGGGYRGDDRRTGGPRSSGPYRGGSSGPGRGGASRGGARGGQGGGLHRPSGDAFGPDSRPRTRRDEPSIPDDVDPKDLDPSIRRDLLSLDKGNAELVAMHLVQAGRLLDSDPEAALAHARAARERAGRIAAVREACGIAAYTNGEWSEALSELRAAKRMGGTLNLLPLIADAERGLGRPERAIETARGDEAAKLTGDERTELRLVEAGARMDLKEFDKAVVTLQAEDLNPGRRGFYAARLFYVYAEALLGAGRTDDAITWFLNTAAADEDEDTDAELRVAELTSGTDGVNGHDVTGAED